MSNPIRTIVLLSLFAAAIGCDGIANDPSAETNVADAPEPGPNNGRLLTDGDFALELAVYETGVPPEFRAWATHDGRAVPPENVDLRIELTRLGNEIDEIDFRPQDDFLRGTSIVYEPHSFLVSVEAEYDGRQYRWEYENFEGRTRIGGEIAEALGIRTMIAGPAVLEESITLYGSIAPDPVRVREVSARFDGAILSVEVALGDTVRAGQTLARIESNESLRPYTIHAPIAGVVTERSANPGEQTAGRRLFTIVDLASVWANLSVFLGDRSRVRVGAAVTVTSTLGGPAVETAVSYVNMLADANQAVTARVGLDNSGGLWALGAFVTAEVQVAVEEAPLAVKRSALQSFRDFTVVYAQIGDEYEVRMLELGRQDGEWAEVLGGLEPGTRYVTENSYVLKADIEKSGASHDH